MNRLYSIEEIEESLIGADLPSNELAQQLLDTMRENELLTARLSSVDGWATNAWDFGHEATDRSKMVHLGWCVLKIKEAANDSSFKEAIAQWLEKHDHPNKHPDIETLQPHEHGTILCAGCDRPMPQTAVPAERAWCSDECSAKKPGLITVKCDPDIMVTSCDGAGGGGPGKVLAVDLDSGMTFTDKGVYTGKATKTSGDK